MQTGAGRNRLVIAACLRAVGLGLIFSRPADFGQHFAASVASLVDADSELFAGFHLQFLGQSHPDSRRRLAILLTSKNGRIFAQIEKSRWVGSDFPEGKRAELLDV